MNWVVLPLIAVAGILIVTMMVTRKGRREYRPRLPDLLRQAEFRYIPREFAEDVTRMVAPGRSRRD